MANERRIIGESAPSTEHGGDPPDLAPTVANEPVAEIGGREGPDPTRYGDWEKNGRCIDF